MNNFFLVSLFALNFVWAQTPSCITDSGRANQEGLKTWCWQDLQALESPFPYYGNNSYPELNTSIECDPNSIFIDNGELKFELNPTSTPNDRCNNRAFNMRAELSTRPWSVKNPPGTEEWFGWRYRFGNNYKIDQDNAWLFFQVHNAVLGMRPQISLIVADQNTAENNGGLDAGQLYVVNNCNITNGFSTYKPTGITPGAGEVLDIVVNTVWNLKNEGGFLQVWINGTPIFDENETNVSTIYNIGSYEVEGEEENAIVDGLYAGNAKWGIYKWKWANSEGVNASAANQIFDLQTSMGNLRMITEKSGRPLNSKASFNLVNPTVDIIDPNVCHSNLSPIQGLDIKKLTVSEHQEGNGPCNIMDGDYGSRWSALNTNEDNQWIEIDLGSVQNFNQVGIAFFRGDKRKTFFDLEVHNNETNEWQALLPLTKSSGLSLGIERFDFPTQKSRYVRYNGFGNSARNESSKNWNSITEIIVDMVERNCPNDLTNDHNSIEISKSQWHLENFTGTKEGNGTCGIEITNTTIQDPWARQIITINLAENNLFAGDNLLIKIDGKSGSGQARLELIKNNKPNQHLAVKNFGSEWGSFSKSIVIPSGLNTIDFWLFSNYNENTGGNAFYDNLSIEKLASRSTTAKSYIGSNKNLVNNKLESIVVSPNPTSGEVTVKGINGRKKIYIFDVSGTKINQLETTNSTPILSFNNFAQGIYFVRVETNDDSVKIIKVVKK